MSLLPRAGRENIKFRLLYIGICIFLWLGIILHLFPVYWTFISSIKTTKEIFTFPPSLWPRSPNFYIYKAIFRGMIFTSSIPYPILNYLKNSVIITGAIMLIQIPITALAAYSLSKLVYSTWNRIIFLFFIGTMFIPGQVHLIPSYLILQNFPFFSRNIPKIPFTDITLPHISLLKSYWGVILPAGFAAFNFLLFKGFFDGIPDEIIHSARIDGASEIGIFRRIVLPLSTPVFAVVAYFTFAGAWNSFLWPLIILGGGSKKAPLAVMMYYFSSLQGFNVGGEGMEQLLAWPAIMAFGIIESIPVFVMFLIFREYLMKGIKLRGFK